MTNKSIRKGMACFAVLLMAVLIFAAPAAAHGVYMSFESTATDVTIKAWYQGGDPMANCDAEITIGNEVYMTGKTNAEGYYTFPIKSGVTTYTAKVIEGEHAIAKKIEISSSGGGSSSGGNPIFGEGPTLFNIIAGFGYIIGIAGIIMYIQSRKNMKKE